MHGTRRAANVVVDDDQTRSGQMGDDGQKQSQE
jgi:hypothetical protein